MYPHTVIPAPQLPNTSKLRVLKSAKSNTKLSNRQGNHIVKGPGFFRGKPLYSLTLEERKTCPNTCQQWAICYGNRMPFARRYEPGPALESAIADDVAYLHTRHPLGVIFRLHILGDFYSEEYVNSWIDLLEKYPHNGIYGYTHHPFGSPVGDAVVDLVARFKGRVSILRSDKSSVKDPLPGAFTVAVTDPRIEAKTILVCPEQMGQTPSCLTCGLCFSGKTSIHFLRH